MKSFPQGAVENLWKTFHVSSREISFSTGFYNTLIMFSTGDQRSDQVFHRLPVENLWKNCGEDLPANLSTVSKHFLHRVFHRLSLPNCLENQDFKSFPQFPQAI